MRHHLATGDETSIMVVMLPVRPFFFGAYCVRLDIKGRDDDRLQPLLTELESLGIKVQSVNRKTLDDKAEGNNHQGIMAKVIEAPKLAEHDLASLLDGLASRQAQPFLLVLDGVTDPHNLGACLRSADAAGVHAVIVPRDKATGLTSIVRKVACGAAEVVPLYQAKLTGPMALVMGAEGKGMRRLTREHCDELVSIPMAGAVSSLNVSVASGVCLFEAVRQRRS